MGWLLTPVIAWAAAFLGGRLGAALGVSFASPKRGFIMMVAMAGLFAAVATWLWAWAIRWSARRQAWSRRRWRERREQRASRESLDAADRAPDETVHAKERKVQGVSRE